MSWLILGGSGQLGRSFLDYLNQNNIIHMAPSSKKLNICSQEAISKFFSLNKPSVVVNCAAWTNVDEAEKFEELVFQVNGVAPGYLAQEAKKIDATYVQISTDYVFSGKRIEPWGENEKVSPISMYGKSKALGESRVMESYSENSYIVRTGWLYSQYGKNFVKTICTFALEGRSSIRVVNDQIGQPTFAGDLVDQIVMLLGARSQPGIYHGTNSGSTSWYGLARKIFEVLNISTTDLQPITSDEFVSLAERPKFSVLGHQSWMNANLPEMKNWELALSSSLKEIYSAISMS